MGVILSLRNFKCQGISVKFFPKHAITTPLIRSDEIISRINISRNSTPRRISVFVSLWKAKRLVLDYFSSRKRKEKKSKKWSFVRWKNVPNPDHSHWFSRTFTYAQTFYLALIHTPGCTSGCTTNQQSYFPHDEFDPGGWEIQRFRSKLWKFCPLRLRWRSNNHGIIRGTGCNFFFFFSNSILELDPR